MSSGHCGRLSWVCLSLSSICMPTSIDDACVRRPRSTLTYTYGAYGDASRVHRSMDDSITLQYASVCDTWFSGFCFSLFSSPFFYELATIGLPVSYCFWHRSLELLSGWKGLVTRKVVIVSFFHKPIRSISKCILVKLIFNFSYNNKILCASVCKTLQEVLSELIVKTFQNVILNNDIC